MGRPVADDALAEAIWGEEHPKSAAKNVQTYVHRLRQRLGEPERITGEGQGSRGADHGGRAGESSAPASPAPSSESPAADGGEDSAPPAKGDVTAPGTELKVGDRAVLPFEYTSDKKGTVAVTVTAIEKGAESDMAAFGEKAKGMTPYFIKMKVENVGGTDLSYSSLKLNGVLEGGAGTGIVLIGDIPGKCESESAPTEFKTAGASYETCTLSATKGAPVTAAEFDEGDTYSDSPVVWAN